MKKKVISNFEKIEVKFLNQPTAAVAQSVRAFALQAEGFVFKSQPRQT